MHLLGPWMTTTKYNSKKNKKTPNERELQSRAEHDKYLMKMGAHPRQRTAKNTSSGNTIPDYQGIDQSKLVPLLVKTIQELEARLTALENN